MKFNKGLYTDCSETDQPEGTYRFAKNIVDSSILGAKENEDGFAPQEVVCPQPVIGIIPISSTEIVVFCTNNTVSEIGLVDFSDQSYTTVYNDPELNFSLDDPIKGEYRNDVNNERIVAFHDTTNVPRIINVDDPSGVNDIEDLSLFQSAINPSISAYSINDFGGALPTGAVIPLTKYTNIDGSETDWFVHDKIFYINDDAKSEAFNLNDGAAPGTISSKSVSFTLSGCDTRFDTILIGYIAIVNNITSAYQVIKRSNATTLDITITGSEAIEDISLDEVITPNTSYSTIKAMTQLGGQLYLANLTSESIPDLQKHALKITIDYTHELVNVISNTDSHKDDLPPTFMPGDVYAFYLGVELKQGGWAFYHIPGREPTATERETIVDANLGITYIRFQVQNSPDQLLATNMAGWENQNELYPDHDMYDATSVGGVDLRNQKVRHHQFPSIDRLVQLHYAGNTNVGITHLPRLGISVSNVNIPIEIQGKINRWKIFYAKKGAANSKVIGSDLYQPGVPTQADGAIRWSSGGNWRLEAQQGGGTEWQDFQNPVYDNIRCHSLDFLHEPKTAAPTYAQFNYKLKRMNLNVDYAGFRSAGCRMTLCGEDHGNVASAVIDYTVPVHTVRTNGPFRKRLDNFAYLPANALSGKFKTQYTEPVFVADIFNPGSELDASMDPITLLTNSSGQSVDPEQFRDSGLGTPSDLGEETLYLHYMKLVTDVFVSFTQQDLVPTEGYGAPASTTLTAHGGDAFICYMSFMTAAPQNSNPDGTIGAPYEQGVRIWRGYIGYSRKNFNYRYQTEGSIGTYFHGKTDVRTLFTPTVNSADLSQGYQSLVNTSNAQNVVNYDTSMNASHIFSVGVIDSPDLIEATEFPNTIIWSPVQNEESKEFSWRAFPAGNRYTISKDKGEILNLQGMKNKELVIHTRHSIYRTRTDAQVQAEDENVFFKSANLFDLPPEDMVPNKAGYGGTQHRFACVLTKIGYVYVDDLMGKVFIYNGQGLDEISTNGMRDFFKRFMDNPDDNTYNGNGYIISYEEFTNRLLISKKDGDTSWTISYNPVEKHWVSFHDYIPDSMFSLLGGATYSLNASTFFKHSAGPKSVFLTEVPSPCYIDVIFASPNTMHVTSLNWLTEIYNLGHLVYNETITHLMVRNSHQSIGRIPVVYFTELDLSTGSNVTRNLDRTWNFNDLRDIVIAPDFIQGFYQNYNIDITKLNTDMEWYDRRFLFDKYVLCRLEYSNSTGYTFRLIDVNYTADEVKR